MKTGPFRKSARVRSRRDFLKVQDQGSKFSADCLLAAFSPRTDQLTRLGLTVSSKVGNAVVRNRIRRHLRELYRREQHSLPKGIDLVLIARSSAAQADHSALARAFGRVLSELKRRRP